MAGAPRLYRGCALHAPEQHGRDRREHYVVLPIMHLDVPVQSLDRGRWVHRTRRERRVESPQFIGVVRIFPQTCQHPREYHQLARRLRRTMEHLSNPAADREGRPRR